MIKRHATALMTIGLLAGFGVLRNLLGITDARKLEATEAAMTTAAIAETSEHPPVGAFDLAHLQRIHHALFKDIYAWAGRLRTVEIVKGDTRFANSDTLCQAASELFAQLRTEGLLGSLTGQLYAERLAHYYSEVNVLHPFREGNGRTQRLFFLLLAAETGHRIAFEKLDAEENLTACIAAYNGSERRLADMFEALLRT